MRIRPNRPISARGRTLGGELPLVCIPLVGKNIEAIMAEAHNVPAIAPDIIELRVDAWDFIEDVNASFDMVKEVRKIVGEMPIILTCRGDWEGGVKKVSDEAKFGLYHLATEEGLVDFIDMELAYGYERIRNIKNMLSGTKISLIVSSHFFNETPSREKMFSLLAAQIFTGADVAKLAVMPKTEEDVISLLSVTLAARREFANVPFITMSMSGLGAVSRIVGGLYGSDLTFAVGSAASAPGQIPVAELRGCLKTVYPK